MTPNASLLIDGAAWLAGFGSLNVHLAGASWVPGPGDTPPPTTETAYGGYAAQPPVFGAWGINGSNQAESDMATLLFVSASPGATNNVYGYWIDDGTNILVEEVFPGGPYDMSVPGAQLSLDISLLVASL